MRKTFVLDTNVLLHNPRSIEMFDDNVVVLPMAVIEELDGFKSNNNETGRNARWVIRRLDACRQTGSLRQGVAVNEQGGIIKIMVGTDLVEQTGLARKFADNRIISVAYHLHQQLREKDPQAHVYFVSKDINCRVKADALGLEAQDFESQKISFDDLYTGWRELAVDAGAIDNFYQEKNLALKAGELPPDFAPLLPNEFVLLKDVAKPKHTALVRAAGETSLRPLCKTREKCHSIQPRSKEQSMALELLLDPAVTIVTLVGRAGTGKTLLALAAGLEQILASGIYDKMLVSRPVIPMGKDIGFLPGSKDNKLAHWMQPIFDNLAFLLSAGQNERDTASVNRKIKELMDKGDLDLEALTYIRGRSIPRQFVIVDEAQNLTPHEVKSIISRAGVGTKMVLTGDPQQIDNPYLDADSNGLSYAVERLKSAGEHGHITLHKSERSPLSAIAAELL